MRRRAPLSILALAVAAAGCGDEEPTGPGSADASVDAVVAPERTRALPTGGTPVARRRGEATPRALSGDAAAREAAAVLERHRQLTAAAPPALTFPVVILRQGPGNPGSHGAPVVDDLADAVSRVAPGGTIRVLPGSYLIDQSVVVDRSVSIEGPGNGSAEFVIDGPAQGILAAGEGPGSVVAFRDLSFVSATTVVALVPTGDYDQVVVDGSSFHMGPTAGTLSIGIAPFPSTVPGATVTVTNSSFSSVADASFQAHGIQVIPQGVHLNVSGSSFGPLNGLAVWSRPGTTATLQGNDFDGCGRFGCGIVDSALFDGDGNFIGVASTTVDMLDNRFFQPSVRRPNRFGDGPIEYFSGGSSGLVKGNLIEGCGRGECTLAVFGASIDVVENEYRIPVEDDTWFGMTAIFDAHITATGNTVVGIGGTPGDRSFVRGAFHPETRSTMLLEDNVVENAGVGVNVVGGSSVGGLDNSFDQVDAGLRALEQSLDGFTGATTLNLRSSDFTNYAESIQADHLPTPGSDLTCNWWGDPAGPQGTAVPSGFDSFYTPWATGPVAGTATTSCGGGV